MRWLGGKGERPGWVKAPSGVELEIRAVWQEDEMPAELTSDPGWRPFTLGPESQAWVDSMIEIADGGTAVFGRPKPMTIPVRRQLATPPPSLPPATRPYVPAPLPQQPPPNVPTHLPRLRMPDIDDAPPPPTQAPHKRVPMPDIEGVSPPPALGLPKRTPMPDIEGALSPQARSVPKRTAMPDIGEEPAPRARTLPRRVLMPDVGEEAPPPPKPPLMPEIG